MIERIKKKIHIFHNIFIKHKYLLNKDSYSMDGEDIFINKFFSKKKMDFILMLAVITQFIEITLFCFIKKDGEE